MPSLSSGSSSVFGKFRRQTSDSSTTITTHQQHHSPPPALPTPSQATSPFASPDRARSRTARESSGHRRDSSILSLSGALDLGASVRRSVSLRGHRSQIGGAQGHKARFPSNGSRITLVDNLQESEGEGAATALPHPPPSRSKLSVAGRSFSQKLKSTETLPVFPTQDLTYTGRPPRTAVADDTHKNAFSMLTAQQPFRLDRRQTDRPSLSTNPSFAREHSNNANSSVNLPLSATNATPISAGGHDVHAIYRQIHETSSKRMATLEYMRKAHEGDIYYFNTLRYTPQSLAQLPSLHPHKLGRRATQFLVLGYSLPALLDLNSGSPLEYLKAFSALLQEFETYQHLSTDGGGSGLSRGRVGQMFKSSMGLGTRSSKGRRSSAANDVVSMGNADAGLSGGQSANSGSTAMDAYSPIHLTANHDFHYLITPHLPFDPDFPTTFSTLCDALVDAYGTLLELVANPEDCVPGVSDAFAKMDKAVRKILISSVQREFEDNTRTVMKGEVAGLGRLVLGGLM